MVAVLAALACANALAQRPPAAPGAATPPARPVRRPSAYPERQPADPTVVERGKAVYGVHCTFCHGADARGGSGGPNLIRNEVVLNDQRGELIAKVLREGREGMPKFDIPMNQVGDIADFIHSFKVGGYDVSRMVPETIVVGDAKSGESYFQKTCAGCHSITGDLKGIASKISDPKQLQQYWLMPGGGRGPGPSRLKPTTVSVTQANGKKTEGRLVRIDDFFVTLTDSEGLQRTFTREGDLPQVIINDPLKPHRDLLGKYTDTDIHDLTAFLVTVK